MLFTLHDAADADRAIEAIEASRPSEGLVSWSVKRSLDERKGIVVAEVAVFEDAAAFERFRSSPSHQAAGRMLSEISDWVIADWDD